MFTLTLIGFRGIADSEYYEVSRAYPVDLRVPKEPRTDHRIAGAEQIENFKKAFGVGLEGKKYLVKF